MTGVRCLTKAGFQELRGQVVIDTSGDLDVAAAAGASFVHGRYLVTTVFRLGSVDVEAAERHWDEEPREAASAEPEGQAHLGRLPGRTGGSARLCPASCGVTALISAATTASTRSPRPPPRSPGVTVSTPLVDYARSALPGFERCFVVDVASQLGVRQTRLLQGEYVVTMADIAGRRHFVDSVARGRDYYTPYRALLPAKWRGLLVAGRHYSAEPQAQRVSARDTTVHVHGRSSWRGSGSRSRTERGGTRYRRGIAPSAPPEGTRARPGRRTVGECRTC